ncbi:MAG: hypothetical protein ACTSXU_05215, partial [Promethearchaeota archaeon]
ALGSFQDKETLKKALQFSLENVPKANRFIQIMSAITNDDFIEEAWSWYEENIRTLDTLHPMHHQRIMIAIISLSGMYNEKPVKSYFSDLIKNKPEFSDIIKMAFELLDINNKVHGS